MLSGFPQQLKGRGLDATCCWLLPHCGDLAKHVFRDLGTGLVCPVHHPFGPSPPAGACVWMCALVCSASLSLDPFRV